MEFPVIILSGLCRHQNRRHAFRLGNRQVLGDILEHRRSARVDGVSLAERIVSGLGRFWRQARRHDVERVLE